MSNMYQAGNPFHSFLTKIFDLCLSNILWFICCIPLVTIAASTSALYYTVLKIRNDEGSGVIKTFFHSFRGNLRQSVSVSLLLIVSAVILIADFHILGHSEKKTDALMYGGCITIASLVIVIFTYVFFLMAKFENETSAMFQNAWKLTVRYPLSSILMLCINISPFVWFMLSPETFYNIFWIWLLLGVAFLVFLDTFFLAPILSVLIESAKKDADNE